MSNTPHSGRPSVPTNHTVSSQSNDNSSTQNRQPIVLTEEQKANRRERNKRRKQNRQRNKAAARNAASGGPAIEPKPPKQRNEPQKKQAKLAITPTISKPPVIVPKPPVVIRKPLPEPFPRFKNFPLWIQRYIFEMAYDAHTNCIGWGDPEDSEYWSAISKQVNEWIEPLIWESMVLPEYEEDEETARGRLSLYEEAFEAKPKEFFTKHVRRIYTNNLDTSWGDSDFELGLLPICDNLTTLECWSYVKKELQTILQTKYWPKLKILCINLDLLPLDENTFRLPLFRNVTRLDFRTIKPQLPSWKSLESLDNLTHMRVNMLLECDFKDFQGVIDHTYNIAAEAQKCLPKKLEYFVILVPLLSLYYFSTKPRETPEDTTRWERMEKVRLGTFDSRIILGSTDDSWQQIWSLSKENEGDSQIFKDYHKLIANIDHQDCPQAWQDWESWQLVREAHQERQSFLASQIPSCRSDEKDAQ